MVASKVLNAHLKTIRGIVVKNFAKIDKRFDSIDERILNIERAMNISSQNKNEASQLPATK